MVAEGDDAIRRRVAQVMLGAVADTDFVLTGASALIEHGLIHRPTQDVDLFSTQTDAERVPDAIEQMRAGLAQHGATLDATNVFPGYSTGTVHWGDADVQFDVGIDWRGYEAVVMDIGPVLDIRDSIGSKTAALYSRYEARDYMDVAAIVLDGRWTPDEVMSMGANNDPGFDRDRFATVVLRDDNIPPSKAFRNLDIDPATEVRMRDALTILRHAAQGNDVDVPEMLEYLEAARAAAGGRAQPVVEQLQTDRRADGPSRVLPRREHTQEHDVER